MKKLFSMILVLSLLLSGNAFAISKIAEDYDQFLDCKLTAIEIFQKGSKKSYTASQVEGVDIQRMTVHIKANVSNNKLSILGISKFLNAYYLYDEDIVEAQVFDEEIIILGLFKKEKNYNEGVVINRMTGELSHTQRWGLISGEKKTQSSFYDCKKAVQKF